MNLKSIKPVFTLLFCIVIISTGWSQASRSHTSNNNAWLMYFGNHRFSERLGIHAEIQLRRSEWFSTSQQLLIRTGLDYYLNDNSRFTVGYAFIETYPYGDFAVPNAFPEHRTWQQFLASQNVGKFKLTHRYRLEQRFVGNAATGQFENGRYENRFRYMIKATAPLTKEWKRNLFLAVYDEIMVNAGKDVAYNLFDQNRLYGAVGINVSPTLKIEVGYLYQLVQLRTLNTSSQVRLEDNHTLQIGLFSTLPFYNAESGN